MAWIAEETFEGRTDEANLTAGTSGTGWSAEWVNSATNLEYADDATSAFGSVSARVVSNAGNTFYTRVLSSAISDSGVVYVSLRKSATGAGVNSFTLRSSSGGRVNVRLNASGQLQYLLGGTWTDIVAFTANVWLDIRITFSVTAGTFSVSYWNGSAWSTDTSNASMTGSGNIDRVGIGGDTGANSWVDQITGTDTHPAGSASSSPSSSASASVSSSPSSSPSPSESSSPSPSESSSPSSSVSSSVSSSPSPSESSSPSPSESASPSSSPSAGSSPSSSASSSPSSSVSSSPSESASPSSSPSPSESSSPSPSESASVSSSPSPSESSSPSASVSASVSSSPSSSNSPSASPSPQIWVPVNRSSY